MQASLCESIRFIFNNLGFERKAMAKRGLYANINAKKKAGKKMRKKGDKGAPTDADFRRSAKTAKKTRKKK